VQVNIKNLVDDAQCYQTIRELRWPDGITCCDPQKLYHPARRVAFYIPTLCDSMVR